MSDYINQLLTKALQIADSTQENCNVQLVEKYYYLHNLWLRYSPIPSRPIFNTAWFEVGVLTETSIFLVLHGFYEQACTTLRMQLDGFLIRLYWDILDKRSEIKHYRKDDRFTNNYWEWERGEDEKYPRNIESIFKKEKYFDAFDTQFNFLADIARQKQLLHKYVHGRPPSRHNSGSTRSSVMNIKFEEKHFDEWFRLFMTNYDFIIVISVLLYPEYIKHSSRHKLLLLTPERFSQINSIVGD